jgi:hypothetical protein
MRRNIHSFSGKTAQMLVLFLLKEQRIFYAETKWASACTLQERRPSLLFLQLWNVSFICLVALKFLFKGPWLLASHASHVSLKLSTGKMVAVFC